MLAAISSFGAGGWSIAFIKLVNFLERQSTNGKLSEDAIILIVTLVFIAIILIFFVKPLAQDAIKWGIFRKMHDKEIDNKKDGCVKAAMGDVSKELFQELSEDDKASKKLKKKKKIKNKGK